MLLGHFSLSYSTLSLADIFLGKKKKRFISKGIFSSSFAH